MAYLIELQSSFSSDFITSVVTQTIHPLFPVPVNFKWFLFESFFQTSILKNKKKYDDNKCNWVKSVGSSDEWFFL